MNKLICIIFALLVCGDRIKLFVQEITVQGIVVDANSKQRLTHAYIQHLQTGRGFYNNTYGEFTANVPLGDTLIASLNGYDADTIRISSSSNIILFYLKRTSIQLQEIIVRDTLKSPRSKLQAAQLDYKDSYTKGSVENMIIPSGGNGVGSGLGIDALYNLFSRQGINARKLQHIIEQDYQAAIVDSRYTRNLVARVTGLSGEKLLEFMQQYRPSYQFTIEANDYEMIRFIKINHQYFRQDSTVIHLTPSLSTPK